MEATSRDVGPESPEEPEPVAKAVIDELESLAALLGAVNVAVAVPVPPNPARLWVVPLAPVNQSALKSTVTASAPLPVLVTVYTASNVSPGEIPPLSVVDCKEMVTP